MKMRFFYLALLLVFLLQSCGGGKSEVFSGKSEPSDFILGTTKPVEFEFEIPADGNFSFALDLVYDRHQLKDFKVLNLYYILIEPDKHEREKFFDVKIHDGKEFLGKPKDPESKVDYLLYSEFQTGISLKKGVHKLKLFANRENQKDIPGMVTIGFKVLQD